ncbi:hypothetical protein Metal_2313 [Methylomicrobium album BG8]|uniref:Uncharacterized protein n=1 Tax=Methylomicrobium album BG8 TaxID=686340 RepID=H8GGT7_METAL|nr:hypothetical protein Metal_2313 [Methylomicrobium album BG8]
MVRKEWKRIIADSQPLVLVQEVDDTPLFMSLFDGAEIYMAHHGDSDGTCAEIARIIGKYLKPTVQR